MRDNQFLKRISAIIEAIAETQQDAINTVADWAATAIAADHLVFLFGSGHSFIATMDTYPRIGSFPGWFPIHELSTSYMPTVLGNQGLRQTLFLEKVEGFGRLVMENYRTGPKDVMVVISNSGVNPMGIDVALVAKEHGLKTVAITSLAHSQQSASRHSSGKRLFEICDQVLDTCVPAGDALVDVPGFPHPVAAASTIAACVMMQSLVAETATKLAEKGADLPVFPSHNAEMSPEQHQAVEGMVEQWYVEHARRTANVFK
ncbi:MAG: SIS domain-containing protein [Chloroflexi bacterium]|nr:MAG: SIS domain-containing protein [Chloroflexota bacterium]